MSTERTIVKLIREIALENEFGFNTYSYDWVKEISKNGKSMYIYGYNFPLNDTSFTQIANDKACTSEILSANSIPNVEHSYFMSPNDIHYVKYLGVDGNWKQMISLLNKYGRIICKPNSGTGGAGLYIVNDESELEFAVNEIFSHDSTLCICPYHNITDEYRVIILKNEVKIVFRKVRPYIIGNGVDNIASLCAKSNKRIDLSLKLDLTYIPEVGEKIEIGWKHNLGQGSSPEILTEGETYDKVTSLAIKALNVIGGKFASVDCVCIDNDYRVLEINGGVMMDNLANSSQENYQIAKKIYHEAIREYFV